MKRQMWVGLVLAGLLSVGAWAQCDCGCGTDVEPPCYESFWTTEVIGISMIVPGEFVWVYNTTTPPRILGWRVETWEGMVVNAAFFEDGPYPVWRDFTWDLTDWQGNIVEPGFYRIVFETTNAGDVSTIVQIIDRCCVCCGCCCWTAYPLKCSHPCPPAYGQPFLQLEVAETRSCSRLSFSFSITFQCEEP